MTEFLVFLGVALVVLFLGGWVRLARRDDRPIDHDKIDD